MSVEIGQPNDNSAAPAAPMAQRLPQERGRDEFAPAAPSTNAKAKGKAKYFGDARWASRIRKRKPRWLWKGRIYRRAVNILTGDPGVGKSTLVCEIVAAFSTGRQLPGDAEPREPMNCMILSSEDFADDTIIWRLEHQGADLSRIRVKDTKVALTPECLKELEEKVREDDIKFIIIDTLTSWMGKEVDLNQTNEVADWINPLREIAKRTGCTFLLVRHVTKQASKSKKSTMHSGIGSVALTGGARSELLATLIGKDPASKTTYSRVKRIKANVGFDPEELIYAIAPHQDPRNEHGVLRWVQEGEVPTNLQGKGESPKQPTTKPLGVKPEILEKLLSALKQASPETVSRQTLVGVAETSASTVDRGLKQLVGAGKVAKVSDGQFALAATPQTNSPPSSSSSRHTPKGVCDEVMMTT